MSSKLILAHSPSADDVLTYYGLVTGKVETGDIEFEHLLEDIEALNVRVINGELDVSALSIHAYAKSSEGYALLPHGLAVGDGNGPLIVAREPLEPRDVKGRIVVVPGQLTSEHLALRLFEPDIDVRFVRFDEVVGYVNDGFADAGVIIQEERFTYLEAGLNRVLDLGDWWHEQTGLPLPLEGNVARRALGDEVIARICRYLRASIQYAFDHRSEALAHTSQVVGLGSEFVEGFLAMYTSRRQLEVGEAGRDSVREFLERGHRAGLIAALPKVDFFDY